VSASSHGPATMVMSSSLWGNGDGGTQVRGVAGIAGVVDVGLRATVGADDPDRVLPPDDGAA
jgi:hypothetical protein